MGIRCKLFGHRWEFLSDVDKRGATIQLCKRKTCKDGRRIEWQLEEDFFEKYDEKTAGWQDS